MDRETKAHEDQTSDELGCVLQGESMKSLLQKCPVK